MDLQQVLAKPPLRLLHADGPRFLFLDEGVTGDRAPPAASAEPSILSLLYENSPGMPGLFVFIPGAEDQLQPLVLPQVSHFSQVPLRTIVKLPHSVQELPV